MKVPDCFTVLLLATLANHQYQGATSAPALEILSALPAVELRFSSKAGVTYRAQLSSSFPGDWRDFGDPIEGTGEAITLRASTRERVQQFFRLIQEDVSGGVTPDGFVRIPDGTFTMGSPVGEMGHIDNELQHIVTISRTFYLGKTEVTSTQWTEVRDWASQNGYSDLAIGRKGFAGDASGRHPVTEVSWRDAVKWCNALSEKVGRTPVYTVDGSVFKTGTSDRVECNWNGNGYRLPTEAEWEYACRARTTTAFNTGPITVSGCGLDPSLNRAGWYCGNSGDNTHRVGEEKEKNNFGLSDMHGNVWEWCWDWYGDYSSSISLDPKGGDKGSSRVHRGGSWFDLARGCRSATRDWSGPSFRFDSLGFRLCLRASS